MEKKSKIEKKQVALIILDGWGYREDTENNAIASANTPFFDEIWKKYPHTLLQASGEAVGLPDGQMGNSEIGHTTIGAGRSIDTDLVRIRKAIDNGDYAVNPAFIQLFDHIKKNNSTLHVMGLLSDGGVHSHQDHLFAFLRAAKDAELKQIAIHIFTDGRDTPPQSAVKYLKDLEKVLDEINLNATNIAFIASVSGRFFAMDRDNNWDRLAKVEQILFGDENSNTHEIKNLAISDLIPSGSAPSDFIEKLYKDGKVDEHIEPIIFVDKKIETHDGVFFFNFRADRARMLSKKILERTKTKDDKIASDNLTGVDDICFVTLTNYSDELDCLVAFPSVDIETTLAKEISGAGLTQAHIAETEKFPHATYFLNGGVEEPYPGESHVLLPSCKDVPTHDLAPKMQAEGIADKAIEAINADTNFIFINFANADMVGHTANVPAIIEGVEEVDRQLKRVVDALIAHGGIAIITADHGNAEVNIDPITGTKHTAHTINLVPCIVTDSTIKIKGGGSLADLTPTVFDLLSVDKPQSMTGSSLLL